ncbi:MAG: DNA translocase FtsK 4TM domain-containing protein [Bacteroidetes bacterium]|nr:DNA translocase FtsK 4TM domain-containing protein [Bacteroidota bacterium]
MAENQNISQTKRPNNRNRQVYAFIGIIISIILLLSIITYSAEDQMTGGVTFSDIWKAITDAGSVKHTNNLMSVIGAIISNWMINATIGYSVIIVPFLGFVWSFYLLNGRNLRKKIVLTNYTIILAVLFASASGLVMQFGNNLPDEWSGVVGFFVARVLSNLIGLAGASLVVFGTFIIVLTLLVDLDYKVTWMKIRDSIYGRIEWLRAKREERSAKRSQIQKEIRIKETQESVKIKTIQDELPENRQRPAAQSVDVTDKPAFIKPASQTVPPASPKKQDSELNIDIHEKVTEAEVDFDDRVVEDKEDSVEEIDYVFPSVDLLDIHRGSEAVNEDELKANAELLRSKLSDFSVEIDSVSVTPGPVVTLYELVPATGVKISRIESLQDDIALALKAKGIRIIAPMPGKGTVGVEIPNHNPSLVTIRSIINSGKFRDSKAILPLAMGKTISGEVYVDDLAKMPHLLIAGSTGSGKSVGINTIITSLIYRLHPSDVKFVIIDPKKIELSLFKKLRNHYLAISPDLDEEIITEPNNAVLVLKSVELEMESRYNKLASAGVRNLADYNEKFAAGSLHDTETVKHRKIPYLIVFIDELADLMITAAKEVEEPIARLAQLARAVGIHLVVATQRPSVDVITGVIKANFPARIAYQVSSRIDSRTILDMNGADQLLGNGDMLYLPSGSPKPHRIQNAFISVDEVERITSHIGRQKGYSNPFKLPSVLEKKRQMSGGGSVSEDELFKEAAQIVVRHQQGSVSLLQRRLKVGYSRAARLIDELEAAGIVGQFDGSKAREVLVETEAELENILKSL